MNQILVVSPHAQHPGHHWANAHALASALASKGARLEVIVPGGTIEPVDPATTPFTLRICAPWLTGSGLLARFVRKLGLGKRHLLEMLACLGGLFGRPGRTVHFIDATHLILFLYVLLTDKHVFYTVLGTPDFSNPAGKSLLSRAKAAATRTLLAWALNTGRFAMICETEAIREAWRPFCGGNIHLIPYAIPLPKRPLEKAAARERLDLPAAPFILLMFGTHRPEKDYETVFKAAELLPEQSVLLLFVGPVISGNDPAPVAERHPLVPTRIVSRFVTDEEAAEWFAASDAVVLPYEDGFTRGSGVLLVACQYNRPVVATRTGHLRDFVERHGTGVLFPATDPAAFAAEVDRLAHATPEARAALQARIRATAHEFSWDTMVLRYLSVYGVQLPE